MRVLRLVVLILCLGQLSACVTNPVTGKSELGLVSDARERKIGEQQYLPSRQMQGGDFVTDPALVAYVQDVGGRLAAVSDRPLDYEFTVLNNSVPNAWALPGGKIAVNRGLLLEINSEAELAAVLGHEIVHAAARHGAKGIERGLLLQGAVVATAVVARDSDYSNYVVGAAALAGQLVNQRYGRNQELESDQYGMLYMSRAGYDPQGAVDLQRTFVRLSEGRREDWLSGFFASHPASRDRVSANQSTAETLPKEGRLGVDEFGRQVARLHASRGAYDAHDEGRKALTEGKVKDAIRLADKAIALEPEEAQFYGLKGDVEFARRRYQRAIAHYSEALRRNDAYFKYYLGRGESYRRTGRIGLARQDLANSAKLLPTADAYHGLGVMAEDEGQIERAIGFYEAAAGSPTPAGQESMQRLVAVDLPRRPDRYLQAAARLDQSGRVFVEIYNRTSIPLSDVALILAWRDDRGAIQRRPKTYRGTIQAGKSVLMALSGTEYATSYDTLEFAIRSANAPGE